MTDITRETILEKLTALVVQLPEGTQTSFPELMDVVFNFVSHDEDKGDFYDNRGKVSAGIAFYVTEDEYFDLDYDLFFRARDNGVYLDDSPFIDTAMTGFQNRFVVRKGATRPEKDLMFDLAKLL